MKTGISSDSCGEPLFLAASKCRFARLRQRASSMCGMISLQTRTITWIAFRDCAECGYTSIDTRRT